MKKAINNIILILGILMILYWLILGFGVRFGQSMMFVWPIAGVLCIGRWAYWSHAYRTGKQHPKALLTVLRVLFCLCLAFFLTVEGIIFAGGRMSPVQGLDYIIVLGAKVNGEEPSGALRNRIQVAGEYLNANPNTIALLSGGQGPDEGISEAECMRRKLTAMGIAENRLIMEDKSTDTAENLTFSRALISDEKASVGIVTNDFHLYRALRVAEGLGWHGLHGIRVATSWISWPHSMMREFIGVVWETVRGNLG